MAARIPSARRGTCIAVYVQATGGRAALDADTLLHRVGHSVGQGLQGRWQDWRRGPDHLLRVDQTGMLRTKWV
jgi:hypothetical protein